MTASMEVRVIGPDDALWEDAIDAIEHRFERVFGAYVHDVPDYFIVALDDDQTIQACASVVYAGEQALDVEKYLGQPAQEVITQRVGYPVARHHIIEALAMVSVNPEASIVVCDMLPQLMCALGARYVVCTANHNMRRLLEIRHIEFTKLIDAVAPEEGDELGEYYESHPQVVVCSAEQRNKHFMARILNTRYHYALDGC